MKIKLLLLSVLYFLLSASSIAAQNNTTVEIPTQTDDLEEIQLKSRMEDSLARDIQSYLGHNRFIINVNVKLEKIRQVIKKKSQSSEKANKTYQPTFLPKLSFPKASNNLDDDPVESLPGLPFVDIPSDKEKDAELEFMRDQIERLQQEQRQPRWQNGNQDDNSSANESEETIGVFNRIVKLTITLAVEDSIKSEQEGFLRNLVYQKSALNDLRGDELKIIKTQFSAVPMLDDETIPESLTVPFDEEGGPSQTWLEEHFDILLLGLLSLLALLLISLIVLNLRKKSPDNKHTPAASHASTEPVLESVPAPEHQEGDNKQILQKTRQEIISLGLGQPQHVQGSMDQLMAQEEKIPMAASIYKVLGRSLFRSIFPNVEQLQLQSIMAHLADQPPDEEQQFQDIQDFYQLLQTTVHEAAEVKSHPFEFLGKLNDSQVLYLIQHEDARIQALVVSQLDAQQGARVLNRTPEKRQAQVIAELGQFETFPLDTFKDVADRLAKAALKVPSFENVNADGLHMLMNMLDNMNSAEENKVLKRLKQEKPDTFYKLRQQYFTFSDVLKTPKQILSNALREVERSFIGRAICATPDEFKIHVLSSLTPKLKTLVKEDLKRYEGRIGAKDIDPARKAIVHKLREYIHTGKFSMDQLQNKKQAKS
ncbi:FliG C-terminal domain-containing protein [Oceaniserpentilla sp. 4NH20-0058]|uniref:FliG C-terminal domain-containing protein n=1 Tax=Oceaniserpentilla sp. 4NH20-0058 TaxID=3127660 RepID=UPI00310A866D